MNYRNVIIFVLFNLFIGMSFAAMKPIVCDQQYALCTSAPCVPDPRNPEYSICSCVVENGDSVGYKTCKQRAPKKGVFKVEQITSTFSFKQFETKKSMNCPQGKPWANCLDAPCTVDPLDLTKAICSCKLNRAHAFFTFGGDCDVNTCATGFWSGATVTMDNNLRLALFAKLNIIQNPWPNSTCPINNKK